MLNNGYLPRSSSKARLLNVTDRELRKNYFQTQIHQTIQHLVQFFWVLFSKVKDLIIDSHKNSFAKLYQLLLKF